MIENMELQGLILNGCFELKKLSEENLGLTLMSRVLKQSLQKRNG
jgi:hypothetical protein